MFRIFSRSASSRRQVDYSFIGADMHSHLIPGIDDGSPNMATSMNLVKGMAELGFPKLITTPHIMWDMYQNEKTDLTRRFDILKDSASQQGIKVEMKVAA